MHAVSARREIKHPSGVFNLHGPHDSRKLDPLARFNPRHQLLGGNPLAGGNGAVPNFSQRGLEMMGAKGPRAVMP